MTGKSNNCPDPEAVRFEITGVQGVKVTVESGRTAGSGESNGLDPVEDGGGLLSLKLDASLKRDFQLLATPHIKVA